MRQCFWTAELLILPFSWTVPTEHTGNTVVATILCVQMKILQEEHTAAPCFAKGKYVYNSTDPRETLETLRHMFLTLRHMFHRALLAQLKVFNIILSSH